MIGDAARKATSMVFDVILIFIATLLMLGFLGGIFFLITQVSKWFFLLLPVIAWIFYFITELRNPTTKIEYDPYSEESEQ